MVRPRRGHATLRWAKPQGEDVAPQRAGPSASLKSRRERPSCVKQRSISDRPIRVRCLGESLSLKHQGRLTGAKRSHSTGRPNSRFQPITEVLDRSESPAEKCVGRLPPGRPERPAVLRDSLRWRSGRINFWTDNRRPRGGSEGPLLRGQVALATRRGRGDTANAYWD